MAKIIDGKLVSTKIKDAVKIKATEFEQKFGRKISLAVVLVGNNPASKVYVGNKVKACEYVGFNSIECLMDENSTEEQVKEKVLELAFNPEIDGILVQLPLPNGIDKNTILNLIPAEKDVDGFLAENVGSLLLGEECTISCTPYGVMKLLEHESIDLCGKNAVVVGRSNIVGKPMAALLLNANCTVTVCHSKTKDIGAVCSQADILVAAVGIPKFVKGDMVKDGAVVIDVGINRVEGKLVGDVDFESVEKKASFITPVPGGVGPMTIAMLMENTCACAYRRAQK
ncbi:MAG: bifunctional methylenetetrahydrofolate dehydrogenase/methenyltetrahydrofolate cyclohydrolase FolD [Clostridia bacterium]|nr:bifunctional methylenetetrahydrofolate dehydrogenase/methenyltetrahydrofolate cyclohydrolase FolD [Clostridia bacterium]